MTTSLLARPGRTAPDASGNGRWWALAALALSSLVIGYDTTVLNVALPQLSTSLHASNNQLQWFADAYTLVVAVAMLPAANLGDRFGRKRFLVASLGVFALASLACAYAQNPGQLIAGRAALGLSGAAMMPLGLAMLPGLFPERADRTRALSLWALAGTVGLPMGPILGGFMLNRFWWGSVFLVSIPLTVVGAIALWLFLPEAKSSNPLPLDVPGAALSSLGLAALIYGFIEAGSKGWTSASTWAPIAAGIALFATFIAWERRSRNPLIELSLFTDGRFCWGTLHATIANFAFFGLLFVVPQYFQSVVGTTPLGAGVRLLPMIAGLTVGTRVAGRLGKQVGSGIVIAVGFVIAAVGLAVGANTSVGSGYGLAATWITLLGLGTGIALPTALGASLSAMSAERAGAGSGLMQALRQVGGTVGVALLGTILGSTYRSHLEPDQVPSNAADSARDGVGAGVALAHRLNNDAFAYNVQSAFVHGMNVTLIVSSALVAAGAILAVLFLPRRITPAPGSSAAATQPVDGAAIEAAAGAAGTAAPAVPSEQANQPTTGAGQRL